MSKKNKVLDIIIIILLLIVIIVTGGFIFRQLHSINRFNLIASYRAKIQTIIDKNHKPLSLQNVDLIDTWMTFRYINLIFKLPPDYLKNSLNILDKHYPNISLRGYIKNNKLDGTTFLNNVKSVVGNYFANKQ